jgi:hypothetical protein
MGFSDIVFAVPDQGLLTSAERLLERPLRQALPRLQAIGLLYTTAIKVVGQYKIFFSLQALTLAR